MALLLAPSPAAAEPVRIVALGDSLVHGFGLPPEDGFVPQMQAWLDEQGVEALLINAGVSGDTTTGGLARLNWTLAPDTDALMVSLGGNDILRGIDPAIARENLDAILASAASRSLPVLLVGISVPANYGTDYQSDFRAIYPELAEAHSALLYPNFLQAVLEIEDRQQALQDYMQSDGIHPNRAGVALIVADMGPMLAALAERAGILTRSD